MGEGGRVSDPGSTGFQPVGNPLPQKTTKGKKMCLAIPMRIIEIDGFRAVTEVDGVRREARLDLLPEAAPCQIGPPHRAGSLVDLANPSPAGSRSTPAINRGDRCRTPTKETDSVKTGMAMAIRVAGASVLAAALLLAAGCGREGDELIGRWIIDREQSGPIPEGKVTEITFREGGTGVGTIPEPVSTEAPGRVATTFGFTWAVEDGQLAVHATSVGETRDQTVEYRIDEDGRLIITARGQETKYRRAS